MKRFITLLFILSSILSVRAEAGVSVDSLRDGGVYLIRSQNSLKCLDLIGGNVDNGTQFHQWECDPENDNQKFRFRKVDGYFEIQNVRSNRCVSVQNQGQGDGVRIHNWDCYGNTDQQIYLGSTNFVGAYDMSFRHSGSCMDVEGSEKDNGKIIYQAACNYGFIEQAWEILDPAAIPDYKKSRDPGFDPTALYDLRSVNSNKCLDLRDWSSANGGILQQNDCSGLDNQKFRFIYKGDGFYEIVSASANKCVSVQDHGQADGTKIHSWDCYGNADQAFRMTVNGFGDSYSLRFKHSDKCMDVEGRDTANGLVVHQWACDPFAPDQAWYIRRVN